MLFGLDEKSSCNPEMDINAYIDPSEVILRPGSNVYEWKTITEMFKDSLAFAGAIVNWYKPVELYVRSYFSTSMLKYFLRWRV